MAIKESLPFITDIDINIIYDLLIRISISFTKWLLVFIVFWIIAVLIKRVIIKLSSTVSENKIVIINLLANTSKIAIIIFGLITASGTIGIDVSAIVAGLGLTGFAVGFALKDTLSNVLSGILVIMYQPFKIHQYIQISGFSGKVVNVNLRYTILNDKSKKILIPNSIVFSKEVIVSDTPI